MNSPFKGLYDRTVTTEDGLKAAKIVHEIAKKSKVNVAICGGLAMHIYGFTRATKDIDLVGDGIVELPVLKDLTFGGKALSVTIDDKEIEVDLIIRNDDKKEFYDLALVESLEIENGLKIVSPEWLVILKHLAGRGKDHMDCVWLLRQDRLVDRNLVKMKLKQVMGKYSFWAIQDLESVMLESDLMKGRDEMNDVE